MFLSERLLLELKRVTNHRWGNGLFHSLCLRFWSLKKTVKHHFLWCPYHFFYTNSFRVAKVFEGKLTHIIHIRLRAHRKKRFYNYENDASRFIKSLSCILRSKEKIVP